MRRLAPSNFAPNFLWNPKLLSVIVDIYACFYSNTDLCHKYQGSNNFRHKTSHNFVDYLHTPQSLDAHFTSSLNGICRL